MKSLFKASTALALVATLSACGGGSVEQAAEYLEENLGFDAQEAQILAASADTDNDGFITEEEAEAAYAAFSSSSKGVSKNEDFALASGAPAMDAMGTAYTRAYNDAQGDVDAFFTNIYNEMKALSGGQGEFISEDDWKAAQKEMIAHYGDDNLDGEVSDEEEAKFLETINTMASRGVFNSSANLELLNMEIDPELVKSISIDAWNAADDDQYYGVEIGVYDFGTHAMEVELTALTASNGEANVHAVNIFTGIAGETQFGAGEVSYEVTNHSYGIIGDYDGAVAHMNAITKLNPKALHVMAAGNISGESATSQNDMAKAVEANTVTGEWLVVGGYTSNVTCDVINPSNCSMQNTWIGATSEGISNDFVMAEATGVAGSLGTSFAAPKVAGLASMIWANRADGANATLVKDVITDTAIDGELFEMHTGLSYDSSKHGHGIVSFNAALSPIMQ